MARKTKEDALATRDHILDTAEKVFQRQGVSTTSLHDIAQAAGVTRGAIYWHFRDKADLFDAMMLRVRLPMEEESFCKTSTACDQPLQELRRSTVAALRKTVDDPQVRRVYEIAAHKVEYVGELEVVRVRHLQARDECVAHLLSLLKQAAALQQLDPGRATKAAAIGLHALIDGLFQNWLLDPGAFDLVRVGRELIDTHLAGLTAGHLGAESAGGKARLAAPPRGAASARRPTRLRVRAA